MENRKAITMAVMAGYGIAWIIHCLDQLYPANMT